jgi:hypothetical protein
MTPNGDKLKQEADGNPETVLEDTAKHERTGFRADDSVNTGSSMDNSTDPLVKNMDQYKKSPIS